MIRKILLMLTLLAGVLQTGANYTLSEFKGSVTVRHSGRTEAARKGMPLAGGDEITVGKNSSVEIYNAATKELYKTEQAGTNTVMGIMLDSRKKSSNTVRSMNERWTLGKGKGDDGKRLYTEGSVKRSMTVYDPEAQNFEVDPSQLALHIFSALTVERQSSKKIFPTEVTSTRLDGNGLGFNVTNTLSHPVYMNLVKVKETGLDSVELSELGQPMSCYVILPGQTISRSQLEGLEPSESHLLIMTYCRFDIDDLIEKTNDLLKGTASGTADASLPVFCGKL